ncbi:hypothetical protein, partial [Palleronia sp.]|uniref:hypothetical protein n=1 Tax=Palleronia sp. TaxID=1940284 RepID=UPI0035C7C225
MSVEQREAKTCGRGRSPDNRQTSLHEPSGASATGLQGRPSEAAHSASDFGSQLLRDTSTHAAREDSELCSRFEPVPASLLGPAKRSASQTRILALALQRTQFPSFIKKSLESRWKVGPDVVRDILRDSGVNPGPEAGLRIPITDALLCEGFSEPHTVWISASAGCRKILSADLLTLEGWIARNRKMSGATGPSITATIRKVASPPSRSGSNTISVRHSKRPWNGTRPVRSRHDTSEISSSEYQKAGPRNDGMAAPATDFDAHILLVGSRHRHPVCVKLALQPQFGCNRVDLRRLLAVSLRPHLPESSYKFGDFTMLDALEMTNTAQLTPDFLEESLAAGHYDGTWRKGTRPRKRTAIRTARKVFGCSGYFGSDQEIPTSRLELEFFAARHRRLWTHNQKMTVAARAMA